MEKTEEAEGRYCPKRPGYCWANLPPKEDQVVKAARSKLGGLAAKNKTEQKLIKERNFYM